MSAQAENLPVTGREELKPGTEIEFTSFTELHTFEQTIAPLIDPRYDVGAWEGRTKLEGILRPKKFYGAIREIVLKVMDEPYEQMLNAKARGWKRSNGVGSIQRTSETGQMQQDEYLGFTFTALAFTTGKRKPLSTIGAEIFYAPAALQVIKEGTIKKKLYRTANGELRQSFWIADADRIVSSGTGRQLKRFVTQPQFDSEAFDAYRSSSQKVAWAVLRAAMMRPISTPMKD
jgi:hypothetical protein